MVLFMVSVSETLYLLFQIYFLQMSLIFSKANIQEVTYIKQCLLLYESEDGQKVNFQKSALSFEPNVSNVQQDSIKEILGVPIVSFHERYLGL